MTRVLTTGVLTAIAAQGSELIHLLEMNFSGGAVRLTTGPNDVTVGGDLFVATGSAMTFEGVQETAKVTAQSVRMTLDGVSQTAVNALLAEDYIGRLAKLWRAHIDSAGLVIADPVLLFQGFMNDSWEVEEQYPEGGGGGSRVRTTFISPLVKFKQKRGITADVLTHGRHFSGDTYFQHMAALTDKDEGWVFDNR